ncbi:MAG: hypothetical protein RQ885_12470 [Desulfurococcales archaeon]|jgi:hypothetical protein|nr:hypothetical protein [Desulfurococcales archaeon]
MVGIKTMNHHLLRNAQEDIALSCFGFSVIRAFFLFLHLYWVISITMPEVVEKKKKLRKRVCDGDDLDCRYSMSYPAFRGGASCFIAPPCP